MASVYAAMKGQFGSTEYFMVTMKARDVASQLVIPKEMPGWEELDLEGRFQREINYNRVKRQIAPYLSTDPDRFFGALIVSVFNHEEMAFEPANDVSRGIPKLYQPAAKSIGFLTLSGGEMLVPLDGQHRLVALQAAISGKDEKQKEIPEVKTQEAAKLANDDVMLIMIRHDKQKSRKIFSKVNRYAKATTKTDNLITADDDIVAIISREIANELIGSRLVNYQSNTLSGTTHYFTTLPTIYEATKYVLENVFEDEDRDKPPKIDTQVLPIGKYQNLYRETTKEYWDRLLKGVEIYHSALAAKGEDGDRKRIDIRKTLLLGKPISQKALMFAVVRLKKGDNVDGSKLSWDTILDRINRVNWASDNRMWQKILMNGSRIVSDKQGLLFASQFIAYYLGGEPLEKPKLDKLRDVYLSHFAEDERPDVEFPSRLFEPQ